MTPRYRGKKSLCYGPLLEYMDIYAGVYKSPITVLLEKRELSVPQLFPVSSISADSKVILDLSLLSVGC